jgi:hypothetical protein
VQNRLVVLGVMTLTVALAQPALCADACCPVSKKEAGQPPQAPALAGTVLETTNVSRYTYVRIDTGTEKIWAAGPAFEVKPGDRVSVEGGMPSQDFYSAAFKRTFDVLYLAGKITVVGGAGADAARLPAGHPAVQGQSGGEAPLKIAAIEKPAGGKTVAEVWAERAALSGKPVTVRAQVVKVVPGIMGRNWLHLRDGTGAEGSNDLTVTTKDTVSAGAIVTASGMLGTDKDFGSGYKYAVILEDATVTAN